MDEITLGKLNRHQLETLARRLGLLEGRAPGKRELVSILVESDCAYGEQIHDIEELADAACLSAELAVA